MTATSDMDPATALDAFSLEGTVAIVTGASSGLGNRFARVLHGAGARVVVGARRLDRLESLREDLGDRIAPVRCDVTNPEDCERLVDVAGPSIDILVNNAGIGGSVAAELESASAWRQTIEVNLTSVFLMCQLVGRRMLARESGSIINVASILGLVAGSPIEQAAYCASKGGLVNLTRELGCQWGRKGVRVNALAPGWFPSEMTQGELLDDPEGLRFIERNTPIGRPGAVNELDGALLFLASRASTFVTGTTLTVDGGWTAR